MCFEVIECQTYTIVVASSGRASALAVLALLGETCSGQLLSKTKKGRIGTKEIEVLDKMPLGASLVRGTKDVGQETTGEDARQDTISLDLRLVQAASARAALALGLVLVDSGAVVAAVGNNAEGEGEGGKDGGELHFGCLKFGLKLELSKSEKKAFEMF